MKTLIELWEDFDNSELTLSQEGFSDLKWHIENDENPLDAIKTARDMIIETMQKEQFKHELLFTIANNFNHEDPDIRQAVVAMIVRACKEVQYAETALSLARFDPDKNVRDVALSGLGGLMNKVDSKLARKMAIHLHTVLTSQDNKKYNSVDKNAAEESVFISMEIFYPDWDSVNFNVLWDKFLDKYCLKKNKTEKKSAENLNQVELIHRSEMTYYNLEKVKDAQRGLLNLEEDIKKEMEHIDNFLTDQSKNPQILEAQKHRIWLERFKDNVRNKFENTHKSVPYKSKNNLGGQ